MKELIKKNNYLYPLLEEFCNKNNAIPPSDVLDWTIHITSENKVRIGTKNIGRLINYEEFKIFLIKKRFEQNNGKKNN